MKIPEKIVCDYCEKDLTVAVEYLILDRAYKMVGVYGKPKLDRTYHFCEFDCLLHWTEAERLSRTREKA